MNKPLSVIFALLFLAGSVSCTKTYKSVGDTHLTVFEKEPVRWLSDSLEAYNPSGEDGIIRLGNGRIILKKISLPKYERAVSATVTVRVESAGDRWDKSGSVFVIPASQKVSMLTVAALEAPYPDIDTLKYENLKGIVPGDGYLPAAELMRFMTPFGVGYYSRLDTAKVSPTRPVYIDGWAPEAFWQADITRLFPLLHEDVWVGVFIDTWTPEGYIASVDIDVQEVGNEYTPLPRTHVMPLVNTLYYFGQEYPGIFAHKELDLDFELPQTPSKASLAYIVTGHGGHSEGDEFTPQRNIVSIDGDPVLDFTPWRTDCASFRRFNPTSGVWAEKREASYIGFTASGVKRVKKEIEELIASSDYSRSNWCPGSQVEPVMIPLEDLASGMHRLEISIPEAQEMNQERNEMNFWLVSAYLVWEE